MLYEVKASGLQLSFNISNFDSPNLGMQEKQIVHEGLGIASSSHFVYDFSKTCFSCYIVLSDQIPLPDCLYFLRYWSICALQLFFSQVVTSQISKLT